MQGLHFLIFFDMSNQDVNDTIRAISLKNYGVDKKGDCVCHVLPQYTEDTWGFYRDITCALEDYPGTRIPIFGEADTQN